MHAGFTFDDARDAVPYLHDLGVTHIYYRIYFLWAYVDNKFGLGYSTPSERAVVNGGSPTTGYLSGVEGPFAGMFNAMAGNAFVDVVRGRR